MTEDEGVDDADPGPAGTHPAPGRHPALDPHLRRRTSPGSCATACSRGPTARARSSTPTTRRSSCRSSRSTCSSRRGLTAPFVPVFTSLRRDDPDAAPRFAQTVLTLAVLVMAAASLRPAAPRAGDRAAHRPGLRRGAAGALPRPVPADAGHADPVRGLDRARRDPGRRAAVPVLRPRARSSTTPASPWARSPSTTRWGSRPRRSGRSSGRRSTSGSACVGILRSSVRLRPRLDLRMPALREFIRLMLPKMVSHPIEPADVPVLHQRRDDARRGQRVRASRSRATSRACRCRSSARRSRSPRSRASPRRGRPATAARSGATCGATR